MHLTYLYVLNTYMCHGTKHMLGRFIHSVSRVHFQLQTTHFFISCSTVRSRANVSGEDERDGWSPSAEGQLVRPGTEEPELSCRKVWCRRWRHYAGPICHLAFLWCQGANLSSYPRCTVIQVYFMLQSFTSRTQRPCWWWCQRGLWTGLRTDVTKEASPTVPWIT